MKYVLCIFRFLKKISRFRNDFWTLKEWTIIVYLRFNHNFTATKNLVSKFGPLEYNCHLGSQLLSKVNVTKKVPEKVREKYNDIKKEFIEFLCAAKVVVYFESKVPYLTLN